MKWTKDLGEWYTAMTLTHKYYLRRSNYGWRASTIDLRNRDAKPERLASSAPFKDAKSRCEDHARQYSANETPSPS